MGNPEDDIKSQPHAPYVPTESDVHREIFEAGRRQGIEEAAKVCSDLSWNKFTGPEQLRQQQRVALLDAERGIRALLDK